MNLDGASSARLQATASIAFSEINRLAAIKTQGGKEGIEAAAKQFESLFIDLMLKGMREANRAFSEGNYLNSSESELHQEMLDHQWAVHLAEHGGVGLADVIVRQLSGESALRDRPSDVEAPVAAIVEASSTVPGPAQVERTPALVERLAALESAVDALPTVAVTNEEVNEFPIELRTLASKEGQFDGPLGFVKKLLPVVKDALEGTPLNPLAVLAQAALETGWGRQVIHGPDGRSTHNLFGVKAGSGWNGDSVEVATIEFHGGRPNKETAQFRAYDSWSEALNDYLSLVTGSNRYSAAVEHGGEPERYAKELQNAGYATDPDYATKIARILASEAMTVARDLLDSLIETGTRALETGD